MIQRSPLLDLLTDITGVPVDLLALGVELLVSDDREKTIVKALMAAGLRDGDDLANALFLLRHPERIGNPLDASETELIKEWKAIRSGKVKPLLAAADDGDKPSGSKKKGSDKPMSAEKRQAQVDKATEQARSGTEELTAEMEAALPADADGDPIGKWFAGHEPDATFLGLRIRASDSAVGGVHEDMRAQLDIGAASLRGMPRFAGKNDSEIRAELGISSIGGLRRPKKASGGSSPSMHCFGMAIDVNPGTNPFVGFKKPSKKLSKADQTKFMANRSPRIIERAMWLLHREHFDVDTILRDDDGDKLGATASWDVHQRASETLAEYLRLADDLEAQAIVDLVAASQSAGDTRDLAWWKQWIRTDRDVIKFWDFGKHPDPEQGGYMDIQRDLVEAFDDAGLTWGGTYNTDKDIMHFDYRKGDVVRTD